MSFIGTTVRFVLGIFCFAMGCVTLVQIGTGKYFADLPPNADSAEKWGSILAAMLTLGLGVVGLRMLTSLLRREKQASPGEVATMFAVLRSLARKTIGFILVLVSTAFILGTLWTLPHGDTAFVTGRLIGACVVPLIFGYVGVKMMFRGDLPAAPSQEPTASPR